jgi:nitroimidazol reductase NimA-like FMN-containing flavoprotein (pyridoxamine 5'-phosphate oxidase superfamily)
MTVHDDQGTGDAWLEELPLDECLAQLRQWSVGRIAVVVNEFPVILPINYRLVEADGIAWIAVRTRPGNVIDRAPMHAAFEIDSLDSYHQGGWSVLVRGTLHRVDPDAADFRARFDPHPWLREERDAWLVIQPFAITGRRLHPATPDWAFHQRGYL